MLNSSSSENSKKSTSTSSSSSAPTTTTTIPSGSTANSGANNSSPPESDSSKNRGWPKGKRRYPKGSGAPKQPLSGYVHFLNERRETVRADNPDITFSELSKKLAAEWSAKSEEEKSKYNEVAKRDKDRYEKEFAEYQQTDSYRQYMEQQQQQQQQQQLQHQLQLPQTSEANSLNSSSTTTTTPLSSSSGQKRKKPTSGGGGGGGGGGGTAHKQPRSSCEESENDLLGPGFREDPDLSNTAALSPAVVIPATMAGLGASSGPMDIPIFTPEFIEHNRARENELRLLRKQTTELEEQNAVLARHTDSIKSAIGKLEVETVQQRQSNASLQQHLDSLRNLVATAFRGVQLPASSEPLTAATADQYVTRLLALVTENSGHHQAIINSAKEIVSRMDYGKISC